MVTIIQIFLILSTGTQQDYQSHVVHDLDDSLLEQAISNATTDVVVLYCIPGIDCVNYHILIDTGCGWCTRMQVVFAAVALRVPETLFFRINCQIEATSCPDITEFPTIKLFPANESDEVLHCDLPSRCLFICGSIFLMERVRSKKCSLLYRCTKRMSF